MQAKTRSRASARVFGFSSKHSVLNVAMKDSAKALSYGLAGRLMLGVILNVANKARYAPLAY